MKLEYVGPGVVGGVPLPEAWPAAGHEEPDKARAAEKLAFRFNEAKCAGWGGKPAYRKAAAVAVTKAQEE